ncbi:MAG: hypothetical protein GY730_08485 [bacterium]|nr:hypothetical protein [bacterium]
MIDFAQNILDAFLSSKLFIVIGVLIALHILSMIIISYINSLRKKKQIKNLQDTLRQSEDRIGNILQKMARNRASLLGNLEDINTLLNESDKKLTQDESSEPDK